MGRVVLFGMAMDGRTVNILSDTLRVLAALLLVVVQFINIVFMQSQVKISIAVSVLTIPIIILGVLSIRNIRKLTQDL